MTLSEIAEKVSRRLGAPSQLTWGFIQETVEVLVEHLSEGREVKIRGLGTFRWVPVKERKVHGFCNGTALPAGRKLKFIPSKKLARRTRCQTTMTKEWSSTE